MHAIASLVFWSENITQCEFLFELFAEEQVFDWIELYESWMLKRVEAKGYHKHNCCLIRLRIFNESWVAISFLVTRVCYTVRVVVKQFNVGDHCWCSDSAHFIENVWIMCLQGLQWILLYILYRLLLSQAKIKEERWGRSVMVSVKHHYILWQSILYIITIYIMTIYKYHYILWQSILWQSTNASVR